MLMDFIIELLKRLGNTVIWVITDLFSKQVHFVPCQNIPSDHTSAKMFILYVYWLHSTLERIILDSGIQFTLRFWQDFLKLLGTTQGLSSSHHPEMNRACERTNGIFEQYLRCYINISPPFC